MFPFKWNLNLAPPNILAPLRGYPTTSIMELNIEITQVIGEEWWLAMVATSFRKSDYKLHQAPLLWALIKKSRLLESWETKGRDISAKAGLKTELSNPQAELPVLHPSNGQVSCLRTTSQLVCPHHICKGQPWRCDPTSPFPPVYKSLKQIWAQTLFTEYLFPFTVYL